MAKTIVLPEGYNGHSYRYFAEPVFDNGGSTVRLRCAEAGKEYMTRWAWRDTWQKALQAQS